MTVYTMVTPDRYELPMAIADSMGKLAKLAGIGANCISRNYKRRQNIEIGMIRMGSEMYRVRKVEIDDE